MTTTKIFKRNLVPLFLLFLLFLFSFSSSKTTTEEECRKLVIENLNEIIQSLNQSKKIVTSKLSVNKKLNRLITHYHAARRRYKEIEFFVEYYSPFEAKFFINGPLVPKIELEISSIAFNPQGFQVLEENLFDRKKTDFVVLEKEYAHLILKLSFLKDYYLTISLEQSKVEDALKLQFIRMMCLTLNGYDCTVNKESILETAYSIEGIEKIIRNYKGLCISQGQQTNYKELITSLNNCRKRLLKNIDSDSFDRLWFNTEFLNPCYVRFLSFCEASAKGVSPINYAVNFNSGSFFNPNSINKNYFSVYINDTVHSKEQMELGKLLFYDPILSGNNKRACASCHQQNKAFTDGLEKSLAFDGISRIDRNSPTLMNAAYQKLFFHDGRVFNLEEQANAVFKNPLEMNSSDIDIVNKLKLSDEYKSLFRKAFKNKTDSCITPYAVLKSISEFIKSLDSRNSRFDKYLRGDKLQLNADEINGYNLFSGKALCGSCHFFPLFNGTVPPMYNDNEFEVIGVPEKTDNKILDSDIGRQKITKSTIHARAFKTPTLRNIELTAPYMHNGVYDNLDSVLVFYNRGGGLGVGLKIENQTLPFDSLGLTKKELRDIKLFLITLTDITKIESSPSRLPLFQKTEYNKRKIGGEY
jgi:cytochrome c peroxidase